MSALIEQLMQQAQLWQASRQVRVIASTESSGYPSLDQMLTGGGWPRGALTECLLSRAGSGELPLLLPLMARLSQQGHPLLWINPPHMPYMPALQREGVEAEQVMVVHAQMPADFLWAYEQGLRSGACGLVLGWPGPLRSADIRRLQLAAESSGSLAFLLRDAACRKASSPAALRLQLDPSDSGLKLDILKRRGGWSPEHPVMLTPKPLAHWYPHAHAGDEQTAGDLANAVVQGPWL